MITFPDEIIKFGDRKRISIETQLLYVNDTQEIVAYLYIYVNNKCITGNIIEKTIRHSICTIPELFAYWIHNNLEEFDHHTEMFDIEPIQNPFEMESLIKKYIDSLKENEKEEWIAYKHWFNSVTMVSYDSHGNVIPDLRFLKDKEKVYISWRKKVCQYSEIAFINSGDYIESFDYVKQVLTKFKDYIFKVSKENNLNNFYNNFRNDKL